MPARQFSYDFIAFHIISETSILSAGGSGVGMAVHARDFQFNNARTKIIFPTHSTDALNESFTIDLN